MDVNEIGKLIDESIINKEPPHETFEKLLRQFEGGIADGSIQIQQQINDQYFHGRDYFDQAKKTKNMGKADKLFGQAVKCYEEWLKLAEQLADGQERIWQQIEAQSWLGRCFLEQARRIKDTDKADELFGRAVKCYEKWLQLTEQLDGQNRIWQKIYAQSWLVRCYVERVKRIKNTDKAEVFCKKQADKYLLAIYGQLSQLGETEKEEIEKRIRPSLRDIDYLNEDWDSYFEKKKQETQESLFKGETSQPQDAVATVLAVLHIPPIELGSIPLAHYTSPHVCHKLFGIGGNDTASPMRIGSSTYMNDPSEGRGLLDLLNQQDLELENKADGASHNAFFTCFSSRVNDLNQFRLYGKEDGVEASGCCLVFNKNGDWLKEADVSVPQPVPKVRAGFRRPAGGRFFG